METLKTSLLITLFAVFISCGFCCMEEEWTCQSGACIPLDELCDGRVDCADESDETVEACIDQTCRNSFRCAYGACVSKTAECNGVNDCADGSDEASALCPPVGTENTKCLDEEFYCDSGECIGREKLCDGISDCEDQSDETVKECVSSFCPRWAFRCGYGACISMNEKCDGVVNCRDGSDEAYNLCGTTPPVTPPPPTRLFKHQQSRLGTATEPPRKSSPEPVQVGCIAPNIPRCRLAYEHNDTEIYPGDRVPDRISITYKCDQGYHLVGIHYSLCFNSIWQNTPEPQCMKFCPSQSIKAVTYRVDCEYRGVSVACDSRIKPGTQAKVTCRVKYKVPDLLPPNRDRLRCGENGAWDYEPFRCEPVCGEELPKIRELALYGVDTNITEVPWHVAIYFRQDESSNYILQCGGTIINAKVIVSAAHCFRDPTTSLYLVAAGKYYRDYAATEPNAQFRNISLIKIANEYVSGQADYLGDLAVLVLSNYLHFSPYISPICIKWEQGADKAIDSNVNGRVAGWGKDETEQLATTLRTADMQATSYADCRRIAGEHKDIVANDKFCVQNTHAQIVCEGDSGGGFTHRKSVGNTNLYFLWGVVSGGVPTGFRCKEYKFTSFTNIQFYNNFISDIEIENRPP